MLIEAFGASGLVADAGKIRPPVSVTSHHDGRCALSAFCKVGKIWVTGLFGLLSPSWHCDLIDALGLLHLEELFWTQRSP